MKLLRKIFKYYPIDSAAMNLGLTLVIFWTANFLALSIFRISDQFNNIEHLAFGAFIGTFVYIFLGKNKKAIFFAILSGIVFSFAWEIFEMILGANGIIKLDSYLERVLDSVFLVFGTLFGIFLEKVK